MPPRIREWCWAEDKRDTWTDARAGSKFDFASLSINPCRAGGDVVNVPWERGEARLSFRVEIAPRCLCDEAVPSQGVGSDRLVRDRTAEKVPGHLG